MFAVLDLKHNEISAAAVSREAGGEYAARFFRKVPSQGIRRGVVSDMGRAADSILGAVSKLRKASSAMITDLYVTVSSPSISVVPSGGMLFLSKYGREITPADVSKCRYIGSVVKLPYDREPIHRIVRSFSVDGENGIKDPLGLEGFKMSVDMNIITIDSSILKNLAKCVSLSGFNLKGVVFSPLAVAFRVLAAEDAQKGSALVNVTPSMTDVVVFRDGEAVDCRVMPLSGRDFLSCGTGQGKGVEELVKALEGMSEWDKVARVVMVGEASTSDEVIDAIEKMTGRSVKTGTCRMNPAEELPEDLIYYTGCLGVIDFLNKESRLAPKDNNLLGLVSRNILSFLDKYF